MLVCLFVLYFWFVCSFTIFRWQIVTVSPVTLTNSGVGNFPMMGNYTDLYCFAQFGKKEEDISKYGNVSLDCLNYREKKIFSSNPIKLRTTGENLILN